MHLFSLIYLNPSMMPIRNKRDHSAVPSFVENDSNELFKEFEDRGFSRRGILTSRLRVKLSSLFFL